MNHIIAGDPAPTNPTDELTRLFAQVAELEAAAYGDAPVRLLSPVDQIGHLHDCVAAQKARANTLNWVSRENRARADKAEARVTELEADRAALRIEILTEVAERLTEADETDAALLVDRLLEGGDER
ncbi:hypothetical protein OG592_27345 [Streptomyces avidinii]|uniref:hypothetical protein n=1 Tax=Streptomyces avidinii TaxID=1895 RepID=UPI00386359A2|nr:hypothetical protein OG592_27345 [Streptomyces avidinii]